MNKIWKEIIWGQYGAAIDMLENAIKACPENVWGDKISFYEFWYYAFHTIFFLDCYSSDSDKEFTPPPPFNRDELDPAGILPERIYTKEELLTYLDYARKKCKNVIENLTEEKAFNRCGIEWLDLNFAELILYNMRHVQHHAAQLNLILRQKTDSAPKWVRKTNVNID
jgi:hypothetical protein